ncbi:chorismate mutase, partial [Streptomyces hirsutus]|uniref:chorismate mutase n=1 Tax=Streptomyces hirsutus TaxID=35620 RepID=UPI0033CA306D
MTCYDRGDLGLLLLRLGAGGALAAHGAQKLFGWFGGGGIEGTGQFMARKLGIVDVPLICAQELDIEGALPRVVRILA